MYAKVHSMRIMLEDFNDGSPAPSVALGRFTLAELNSQVTAVVQALLAHAVGTTVVGLAISGTATAAALATSQLTGTATLADLTTDDVTTDAVWSSSDVSKATVGAATGLVTGVAAGVCNITCTYAGFSDVVEFTVT
jgi:uncharacterized protein YjdB